ncbi:hypothetical protein [Pelagicoccus sp. SDUM812003]|uniref:hypothetical protein n=1 Tax=Pelagicoccus sp. SDUM812003 TaxID=3041267 RepID=UPI00280F799E|nr:hypothetical protein [Pelagicoccus sp. SDUM812003]MDQ8203276.1 hypothetical protein [Pelagicoccus sp. SDUM812003]
MKRLALLAFGIWPLFATAEPEDQPPIDREALVSRHNPSLDQADTLSALSLGNGAFAFTADITGLQSFPEAYAQNGIPLSTQSEWGWHSFPNSQGYRIEDTYRDFDTYGRPVPYPYDQHSDAGQWLRGNPHRIGLGTIGLEIVTSEGAIASLDQIEAIDQKLDLWTGTLTSRFEVEGDPIEVVTVCHPDSDTISAEISSPMLASQRLRVSLRFAYGKSDWGIVPEDWMRPDKHQSKLRGATILRTLDETAYQVSVEGNGRLKRESAHRFSYANQQDSLWFSIRFSAEPDATPLPSFPESRQASATEWSRFWTSGGVVDLSGSADPRAAELERRIVLSQYLTAIQCRGSLPPQETGLTFNSWYGKPHLEMHWWHAVHFALWDRIHVVETALSWYEKILPKARSIASLQGYAGARWPKNVDAEGNQVPSTIAPLLIWQQPHPIYFAELCYRQNPSSETLLRYLKIVTETADFMADYAHRDSESGAYHLGPPLIPAQESYDPRVTRDPPFELVYWRWGLETAQRWLERLGKPRASKWDQVLDDLAPLPLFEDRYATAEGVWNPKDHPSVVAIKGMLPGKTVDDQRLERTLRHVMDTYDWQHTWGWDYPMMAMTAARLGEPQLAIEALLLDVQKNTYSPNGHNFQEPENLRIYLPGNGGLLTAIAMMAAGWDGAPEIHAPGFPQDGSWKVSWENLHPMP